MHFCGFSQHSLLSLIFFSFHLGCNLVVTINTYVVTGFLGLCKSTSCVWLIVPSDCEQGSTFCMEMHIPNYILNSATLNFEIKNTNA